MEKKTIWAFVGGIAAGAAVTFFLSQNLVQQEETLTSNLCGNQQCNVILIVSDTLAAENMSIYGYERNTTPYLQSVAEGDSVVFKNALASASWTPPSMISLFFSRPSFEMTLGEVFAAESNFVKVLSEAGVPSVGFLKQLNMKTFYNASDDSEGEPFVSYVVSNNFEKAGAEVYATDYYAGDGQGFIDAQNWLQTRKSNEPYFMFIHDVTVHDPYNAPAEFQGIFDEGEEPKNYSYEFISPTSTLPLSEEEAYVARKAYDQEVRYFDAQVEKFITSIGDLSNTIVIVTSDHGEIFGEVGHDGQHGRPSEVKPAYSHNQVLRIPLMVFGGGIQKSMNTCPVSLLDVAPTVLSLLSVEIPESYEGKNIMADSCAHDIVYSEQSVMPRTVMPILFDINNVPEETLFPQRFFERNEDSIFTVRDERFKVIEDGQGLLLVFDMENDPKERNNLAEKIEEMSASDQVRIERLRTYLKDMRE